MRSSRRNPFRTGKAPAWGCFFVLLFLLAGPVALEIFHANLFDTEFDQRLTTLRCRMGESPERPVLMLFGSSRMVMAFCPEALPPMHTPDGKEILPFNYSHMGAGPVMNLIQLRRLLKEGIRPRWLLVELMPSFLSHEGRKFIILHVAARDLPVLRRYMPAGQLYARYASWRVQTGLRYLGEALVRSAPQLALEDFLPTTPQRVLHPLGGCSFLLEDVDAGTRQLRTETTRGNFFSSLQQFHILPDADRATRELVHLARANGIQVALIMTPEGSVFRSWYSPETRKIVDRYAASLERDLGVAMIDAREWLADEDFFDYHHVLQRGATAFTRRLGDEVIRSLIEGHLLHSPASQ